MTALPLLPLTLSHVVLQFVFPLLTLLHHRAQDCFSVLGDQPPWLARAMAIHEGNGASLYVSLRLYLEGSEFGMCLLWFLLLVLAAIFFICRIITCHQQSGSCLLVLTSSKLQISIYQNHGRLSFSTSKSSENLQSVTIHSAGSYSVELVNRESQSVDMLQS